MKFKNYQIKKIKSNLKDNTILLFSNGANQKSPNCIYIEQGLKKLKINFYKSYNKLAIKILNTSIFTNIKNIISGPFFFLTPVNNSLNLNKNILLKETLEPLIFRLLAIKLNTKIYSIPQIKKINSLKYKDSVSLLYQFLLIQLKFPQIISKQCDLNT